ncbi:TRAP transporter substrate-binding protein [Mesorhizobium sp. CAU 1732]|uniref:TRAP transporter substrate-binding protein n=1 Tax=Mesorhizobium sp. CAU 1732 TaxID=3140358 RepID=UPI00325FEEC0
MMKLSVVCGLIAAVGMSTVANAQERVRWRMHSSYSQSLPIPGAFDVFSDSIKLLSNDTFDIRVFEPGALVSGAQYYDAVSEGALDAAYGSPGYNVGKNSAYAFFAAIPFGPGAGEMLAWLRYGGGTKLAQEYYARDNIHMLPCGLLAPETSGWFRKEVDTIEDLRGLKMRFLGLGAKVMEKFGVSTQLLASGEVYQALELGVLDAAEQSNPVFDRSLGLYQIAKFNYFPGWHQQSTVQELLVNMDSWNKLSDAHKELIEISCDRLIVMQFADGEGSQYQVMKQNEADGVVNKTWPPEMLDAFEAAWGDVVQDEVNQNPDSARVWESLSKFREDYKIWGDRAYLK